MKNLKLSFSVFFLIVLLGTLVSCKSTSTSLPPEKTEVINTITETVTIHDTVIKTEKDSSYYKAYIECKDGKPVIKGKPQTKPGKNLQAPDVKLDDNILIVDCVAAAKEYFLQWKEKFIREYRGETKQIPYPVPAEITGWQSFQIWSGRIFWVLFLLLLIGMILRSKKVI